MTWIFDFTCNKVTLASNQHSDTWSKLVAMFIKFVEWCIIIDDKQHVVSQYISGKIRLGNYIDHSLQNNHVVLINVTFPLFFLHIMLRLLPMQGYFKQTSIMCVADHQCSFGLVPSSTGKVHAIRVRLHELAGIPIPYLIHYHHLLLTLLQPPHILGTIVADQRTAYLGERVHNLYILLSPSPVQLVHPTRETFTEAQGEKQCSIYAWSKLRKIIAQAGHVLQLGRMIFRIITNGIHVINNALGQCVTLCSHTCANSIETTENLMRRADLLP